MTDSRYVQEGEERVLAFYFSTLGFGYTLMKTPIEVLDKGMVCIAPVDNVKTMQRVRKLIRNAKPERIVIEDFKGKMSHKSQRIKNLLYLTERLAKQKGISCAKYSREQIRMVFRIWDAKTRYEIARVISENVPSYENIIFFKPKYPRIEHFRSAIFDAASLAITHYYVTQ